MVVWRRAIRARLARVAFAALGLLLLLLPAQGLRAQGETQPYAVTEVEVAVGPGNVSIVRASGSWVAWIRSEQPGIQVRNLATGESFTVPTEYNFGGDFDLDGETVVMIEQELSTQRIGVFGYRLSDRTRFTIAPLAGGEQFSRVEVRLSGNRVIWREGYADWNIVGHDLATGQNLSIVAHPARQERPAVGGNVVVWLDNRHAPQDFSTYDLYGYDLAAQREFRITGAPAILSAPVTSGSVVLWWHPVGNDTHALLVYDVATGQTRELQRVGPGAGGLRGLDVDGNLVVWSDGDVHGYDLATNQPFIVSRAIGGQANPQVSGQLVAWADERRSGVGRYEYESDLFGARLEPGPAPVPPVIGAPDAADAKIQIVWPHGGAPVSQANLANVAAWLFEPGTLNLTACQWRPTVQLWRAVNSEPAQRVEAAIMVPRYGVIPRAIPEWQVNDVDVSAARDPQNRVYFFVTIEGTPSRSNVWAHAADARTFFPQQDVPTGASPVGSAVDAKIEIVWPHGNAPVSQATRANVTAMLFAPGTRVSVPPDWNPTVRLLRAQNNNVQEAIAVGQKRLVQGPGFTYPVWDFNDVDVSAARDPNNKLYFTLEVDGVQTFPNVWVHGVDARTFFPQQDVPTRPCP